MNQPTLPLVERAVTQALDAGRIPGAVVLVARDAAVSTRRFWAAPSGWSAFMYVPDQDVQLDVECAIAEELSNLP